MGPQPLLTHELQGIARSQRNFSLREMVVEFVWRKVENDCTVGILHNSAGWHPSFSSSPEHWGL